MLRKSILPLLTAGLLCALVSSLSAQGGAAQDVDAQDVDAQKGDAPRVALETTKGTIVLELDAKKAPITVENFLGYVQSGFFNGTVFHRVIPRFMIQGGGFTAEMQQKETREPIQNEAKNGLSNDRGTIAMARRGDPDSATAQFFINVNDNHSLNPGGVDPYGYAVFGKVVEGMDVVDAIVAVPTTRRGPHANVPVEPIVIEEARVLKAEMKADENADDAKSDGEE